MIQQTISPLQLYKSPILPAGLTESNHLSRAFLTEPHKIESMLMLGLGQKNGSMLQMLTGGLGNTITVDNNEYRWGISSNHRRAIFVKTGLTDAGGASYPGLDGTTFRIILEEKAFGNGDVLISDLGTQVRVQGESYVDEGGHVYTVQLVSNDPAAYIDPTDIAAGARFSKLYSAYEEFSIRGNSESEQAPFMLQNHLTILRQSKPITRSAATDYLIMDFANPEDPKGPKTRMWTRYIEQKMMFDWIKDRDYHMVYGKYNKTTIKGENGRVVKVGAGLRDQIAPSNIYYTNKVNYDLLEEILYKLSYNGTNNYYGGNQKFVILTGRMGMKAFSDAIMERYKGVAGIIFPKEGQFITGTGNELTFAGDQFVTAHFPTGISCTVVHMPLYDDRAINRAKDPISGELLESYRMTIINTTGSDGKSNIRRVVKKGSDNGMWHVTGSMDPASNSLHKSTTTRSSSGIDGYEIHFLTEEGLMLENPLSAAEVIRAAV